MGPRPARRDQLVPDATREWQVGDPVPVQVPSSRRPTRNSMPPNRCGAPSTPGQAVTAAVMVAAVPLVRTCPAAYAAVGRSRHRQLVLGRLQPGLRSVRRGSYRPRTGVRLGSPSLLARRPQSRAARRGDPTRRAAPDPGRRRHGEDDHPVRPRGVARGPGHRAGADHAAHLHAPRGARDAPADARGGSDPGRLARGARRDVSLGRPPARARAQRVAGARGRVLRARRGRRRRRPRPDPRGARICPAARSLPEEEHAARHLLAHGQLPDAALGGHRRIVPLVRGAHRRDRRAC